MRGASGFPNAPSEPAPEPAQAGAPTGASEPAQRLTDRYGPQRDGRSSRRTTLIVATTLAVLATAFLAWVISDMIGPTVETQEVSFVVAEDQASVEVTFDITMPVGSQADCTLESLDTNFGQAGLLDVRLGPFDTQVTRISETIHTSAAPVTGNVRSCELVE